ncbi:hypothetical protein [Gryllotalpicola koreensis]|uniref:LPXTG cell wall anchor domain-containing protein n=1 Tax=Gryllotalpicola koreensis TaxID=993086 RepID=A0ABP8A0E7_9MICO
MNRLIKAAAVLAVAGAAVFGGPLAANAATYTPGTPTITGAAAGTVTGSTAPGGTFTVHFNAIFQVNHDLTVYFFSAGNVPTSLADFRAAESPALAAVTDGTGAADVTATMPVDASSPVTVEATDGTTTAAITIPVEGAAAAAVTTANGATPLATTGSYISLATVWAAVGLVVLGAAFIGIRSYRKQRQAEAPAGARRP